MNPSSKTSGSQAQARTLLSLLAVLRRVRRLGPDATTSCRGCASLANPRGLAMLVSDLLGFTAATLAPGPVDLGGLFVTGNPQGVARRLGSWSCSVLA
ncbi:MAG: hypothetical protein R3F30_07915 [Planctomycetota bacterium]